MSTLFNKLSKDNFSIIISLLEIDDLLNLIQAYPNIQSDENLWLKVLQMNKISYEHKAGLYCHIYLLHVYDNSKKFIYYVGNIKCFEVVIDTIGSRNIDGLLKKFTSYLISHKLIVDENGNTYERLKNYPLFNFLLNCGNDMFNSQNIHDGILSFLYLHKRNDNYVSIDLPPGLFILDINKVELN